MGHPQVKCPHCGTIIDTQLSPGAPEPPAPEYGAPPPTGFTPAGPPAMPGPAQMPPAYIAPQGMSGVQTIQHAGLFKRFIAWIIDVILLAVITIPVGIVLLGSRYSMGGTDLMVYSTFDGALFGLLSLVISLGYFIYMEGTKQQTIGKMALDIIVVGEDLRPVDMDTSFKRNILRVLYEIPVIFIIIDALLIYGDEQRIGDKFAHTYVIEKNFYDYIQAQSLMGQPQMVPPPQRPQNY